MSNHHYQPNRADMVTPVIQTHFFIGAKRYEVSWYDLAGDLALPKTIPFHQVYAIGNLDGLVPVVKYPDSKDNLPGGQIELGETVDQALRRELIEEINMEVLDWHPLGYQQVLTPEGAVRYEARVYATLRKIGEWTHDPGGSIIGHELVQLSEVNRHIQYGEVGERMMQRAQPYFLNVPQQM